MKFNISIRNNYREEDQKVKDYVEKCKVSGTPTFLQGWGKGILSDATSKITNSGQCPPHRRDLTNLQHEEWNNIGELIWHWTLSRDARI